MKRIMSFVLALILLMSTGSIVSADNPYTEQGEFLNKLGVLLGDENGNLNLDSKLTREQMVVLISRLYGKEDEAKNYKGVNVFKDLGSNQAYYIPYILWAKNEGLIVGMTTTQFGYGQTVTVQQFQTVLLRALGYTDEAKNWSNVPTLAQNLGIMKGLNFAASQTLTRGEASAMIYNALALPVKGSTISLMAVLNLIPLDISYDAKVVNDSLNLKGSVKDVSELKLYLKSNNGIQTLNIPLNDDGSFDFTKNDLNLGEYSYIIFSGTKSTEIKTFSITNIKFDLSSVFADNLKEIKINLNKPVDTNLSSFVYNYETNAGAINRVYYENVDKTIVLVLNGTMENGKEYTLTAKNIRSTTNEVVEFSNKTFTANDTTPPRVTGIDVLGTTGIRINFSEPIKTVPSMSNFNINATTSLSNPVLSYESIELRYSTSTTLAPGTYTILTQGLEDFAGNKINIDTRSFTVVKDTSAPEIVKSTASVDQLTVEFNELINPITVTKESIYWKQDGVYRKYPDSITVDGKKVIATFNTNPIPNKETSIFIEGIGDYSDNKISQVLIKVTPTVDTRKPEVVSVMVGDTGKFIKVIYNKAVLGNVPSSYSVVDANGSMVLIKDVVGSGREYTINFYSTLPKGAVKLTVSEIKDVNGTKIEPYTTTLNVKDFESPRLLNYSGYGNTIIMEFSKPMDEKTTSYLYNYIAKIGGTEVYLIQGTQINLSPDLKTLTIVLPDYMYGKKVMIGAADNLTNLEVRGLKDTSGNFTDPLILSLKFEGSATGNGKVVDYYPNITGKQAVLTEPNLIKVKFNMPIIKADISDFVVAGHTISRVIVDGSNTVQIVLADSTTYIQPNTTVIPNTNKIKTSIGTNVDPGLFNVVDEVSPVLKSNLVMINGNNMEITFSEPLEEEGASLYRRDLQIIRLADNKVLSTDDYTTTVKSTDKSTLVITLKSKPIQSKYSIRVIDNPIYIRDLAGNLVKPSQMIETIQPF